LAPMNVSLLLNLLMVQTWGFVGSFDSPAWSISTEWAAYLLFPLLVVPALFRRPAAAWLAGALSVTALALLSLYPLHDYNVRSPLNIAEPQFALPVVRCVADFVLGLLAFRLAGSNLGRVMSASPWIAPALCLATLAVMTRPGSDLAVVLLFPLVVAALSSSKNVAARILGSPPAELLGKLSFSIYLTHKLFFGLLASLDQRAHAAGLKHPHILAVAACIVLTGLAATLAYKTIEVPGRRWLREIFERRSSNTLAPGGLSPTGQKA
jgi:peptidoglycan/LPS O-acetylase OafA/YrhL